MRKVFLNTFLFSFLILGISSCKNDKGNEATVGEAKESAISENATAEFTVDTSNSVIHWSGSKPTGTHTGTIKLAKGTFKANDSLVESGQFTIAMGSIVVTDLEGKDKTDLENHLKGTVEGKEGDFFNTQKYPEATFEVTDVTEENGETIMEGNLTIKEETKNISFPVNISKSEDKMEITSEEFTIDRTKWNVNFGSKSVFDGLGDNFLKDEVELKIHITATKA